MRRTIKFYYLFAVLLFAQACTVQNIDEHLLIKVYIYNPDGKFRKDLGFEKKIDDTIVNYHTFGTFEIAYLDENPQLTDRTEFYKRVIIPSPVYFRSIQRRINGDFYYQPHKKERPNYWEKLYSFDKNEKLTWESVKLDNGEVEIFDGHRYSGKDTIIKINNKRYKCGLFYKGGFKDWILAVHKKSGLILYENENANEIIYIDVIPLRDTTRIVELFRNRKKYEEEYTR